MVKEKSLLNEQTKITEFVLVLRGLLATLFVICFFYVIDWSFLSGSIVEYPVMCPEDYHEGNGCYALNQTIYYPDTRTQTVKMRSEGFIDTLKKCTVIDRKNWQCEYNDGSATFGFNGGQFSSVTLDNSEVIDKFDKMTRYVPRYIYLFEQWQLM